MLSYTLFQTLSFFLGISSALPQTSPSRSPGLLPIGTKITGHATFYSGNTNGACGKDYAIPKGFLGVAVSSTLWSNSQACGSCYKVSYGSVTKQVFVADLCPECTWTSQGGDGTSLHQDLFQTTWTELAAGKSTPSSAGVLRGMTWTAVPCGFSSLSINWKEGTNDQWAALAPRNQNVPVTKFEVRRKDVAGTWTTLKLDSASAHYVGPTGDLPGKLFDVRLTGSTGRTLTLTNVRRNDNKQTFDTNF